MARPNFAHIAANDPAFTIRVCTAALNRLERHAPTFDLDVEVGVHGHSGLYRRRDHRVHLLRTEGLMATCLLCPVGDQHVPDDHLVAHLDNLHAVELERWPDDEAFVVIDTVPEMEDFR